jgi:activator of HSP90 ATPase
MSQVHQEITFAASRAKVYSALMDSKEHAAFTGAPAEISSEDGGAFSVYGGKVEGRNVQLVRGERIVQAWRAASWAAGIFSIARFELRDDGGKTTIVLDHDGIPDDQVPHIDGGWKKMYWEPLKKYVER